AGLLIDGVRVGEAITDLMPVEHSEGSCVVVVATDAPLLPHQLTRVAQRAGLGLARGGSYASNGSGEQLIAFSTANRFAGREPLVQITAVGDGSSRPPSSLAPPPLSPVRPPAARALHPTRARWRPASRR